MKKRSAAEIEKMLANAKASLALEGMEVTEQETEVLRKYLLGIYSDKDVLNIIKAKEQGNSV